MLLYVSNVLVCLGKEVRKGDMFIGIETQHTPLNETQLHAMIHVPCRKSARPIPSKLRPRDLPFPLTDETTVGATVRLLGLLDRYDESRSLERNLVQKQKQRCSLRNAASTVFARA